MTLRRIPTFRPRRALPSKVENGDCGHPGNSHKTIKKEPPSFAQQRPKTERCGPTDSLPVGALAFCGCCNKMPQLGSLSQQKRLPAVLQGSLRSWLAGLRRIPHLQGDPALLLPASGHGCDPLVFLGLEPQHVVSASICESSPLPGGMPVPLDRAHLL